MFLATNNDLLTFWKVDKPPQIVSSSGSSFAKSRPRKRGCVCAHLWAPFATKRSREGSGLWGRVRVQLNELPKFIRGERLTGRAPETPNVNAVVQKVNLHIDAKSSLGPPKNCGGLHSNHGGRGLAGLMGARPPNSAHGGSPPRQRSRCAHRPVRGASASVVCELRAPAARGCWLPGGTIPTAARLRSAPDDVGIAVSFSLLWLRKDMS
jgi:hypothetical protein